MGWRFGRTINAIPSLLRRFASRNDELEAKKNRGIRPGFFTFVFNA